jgi:glycosyltransferase involved in cell wall biosynthesis
MKKNGIKNIIRVEGDTCTNGEIKTGIVLDFFGRAYYSLTQNAKLIKMIQEGQITSNATIYYDDFWTPGMDAVMYTAQLAGIKLNIYAMLHAQSVDKYDFTYQLKNWLRSYEIGQSKFMKGIFVTSEYLLDLCTEAGIENVYYGGLPYNKEFILNKFPVTKEKIKKRIMFCSRFDSEKNPDLFLSVARKLKDQFTFVMTTSFNKVSSNDKGIVERILNAEKEGVIELKTNLTKTEYYEELQKSQYQFNCAKQDWLSWTLLEALTYKCIPIYPRYRSFPEYLDSKYLYTENDVDSAVNTILNLNEFEDTLNLIVDKFDNSFSRYVNIINKTQGV